MACRSTSVGSRHVARAMLRGGEVVEKLGFRLRYYVESWVRMLMPSRLVGMNLSSELLERPLDVVRVGRPSDVLELELKDGEAFRVVRHGVLAPDGHDPCHLVDRLGVHHRRGHEREHNSGHSDTV